MTGTGTAGLSGSGIDWLALVRGAIWITGLAIALAVFSHASWRASVRGLRLPRALAVPAFRIPFAAGMLLFTAGLAWGAVHWWERLAWLGLLIASAWSFIAAIRADHKRSREGVHE